MPTLIPTPLAASITSGLDAALDCYHTFDKTAVGEDLSSNARTAIVSGRPTLSHTGYPPLPNTWAFYAGPSSNAYVVDFCPGRSGAANSPETLAFWMAHDYNFNASNRAFAFSEFTLGENFASVAAKGLRVSMPNATLLRVFFNNGATDINLAGFGTQRFHHIAVTIGYSNATSYALTVYYDGQVALSTVGSYSDGDSNGRGSFCIGATMDCTTIATSAARTRSYGPTWIDNLRAYSIALSQADVQNIMYLDMNSSPYALSNTPTSVTTAAPTAALNYSDGYRCTFEFSGTSPSCPSPGTCCVQKWSPNQPAGYTVFGALADSTVLGRLGGFMMGDNSSNLVLMPLTSACPMSFTFMFTLQSWTSDIASLFVVGNTFDAFVNISLVQNRITIQFYEYSIDFGNPPASSENGIPDPSKVFTNNQNLMMTTDRWYHIAVVIGPDDTASTRQVYLDGVLVFEVRNLPLYGWSNCYPALLERQDIYWNTNNNGMYYPFSYPSSGVFTGGLYVDYISIWNRVLTATDVAALYIQETTHIEGYAPTQAPTAQPTLAPTTLLNYDTNLAYQFGFANIPSGTMLDDASSGHSLVPCYTGSVQYAYGLALYSRNTPGVMLGNGSYCSSVTISYTTATISVWFATTNATETRTILYLGDSLTVGIQGGNFKFTGTLIWSNPSIAVTASTWHHIAVSLNAYTGSSVSNVAINGALAYSGYTNYAHTAVYPFYQLDKQPPFAVSYLSQLVVWSYNMANDQLLQLYSIALGRVYTLAPTAAPTTAIPTATPTAAPSALPTAAPTPLVQSTGLMFDFHFAPGAPTINSAPAGLGGSNITSVAHIGATSGALTNGRYGTFLSGALSADVSTDPVAFAPLTVAFWYGHTAAAAGDVDAFLFDSGITAADWAVGVRIRSGVMSFDRSGMAPTSAGTPVTLANNSWHHCVAAYDYNSDTWTTYVDGTQVWTSSIPDGGTSAPLSFFHVGTGAVANTGYIDRARAWNYAMHADQVALLYAQDLAGVTAAPTSAPTGAPTRPPTAIPSAAPSRAPSATPTRPPTPAPTALVTTEQGYSQGLAVYMTMAPLSAHILSLYAGNANVTSAHIFNDTWPNPDVWNTPVYGVYPASAAPCAAQTALSFSRQTIVYGRYGGFIRANATACVYVAKEALVPAGDNNITVSDPNPDACNRTWSIWYARAAGSADRDGLWTIGYAGTGDVVRVSTRNGTFVFEVRNTTALGVANTTWANNSVPIGDRVWHYLLVSADPQFAVRAFVDGVQVYEGQITGTGVGMWNTLCQNSLFDSPANASDSGVIYQITEWEYPMSAPQVAALYTYEAAYAASIGPPSSAPTGAPTAAPTGTPTGRPTSTPTAAPTTIPAAWAIWRAPADVAVGTRVRNWTDTLRGASATCTYNAAAGASLATCASYGTVALWNNTATRVLAVTKQSAFAFTPPILGGTAASFSFVAVVYISAATAAGFNILLCDNQGTGVNADLRLNGVSFSSLSDGVAFTTAALNGVRTTQTTAPIQTPAGAGTGVAAGRWFVLAVAFDAAAGPIATLFVNGVQLATGPAAAYSAGAARPLVMFNNDDGTDGAYGIAGYVAQVTWFSGVALTADKAAPHYNSVLEDFPALGLPPIPAVTQTPTPVPTRAPTAPVPTQAGATGSPSVAPSYAPTATAAASRWNAPVAFDGVSNGTRVTTWPSTLFGGVSLSAALADAGTALVVPSSALVLVAPAAGPLVNVPLAQRPRLLHAVPSTAYLVSGSALGGTSALSTTHVGTFVAVLWPYEPTAGGSLFGSRPSGATADVSGAVVSFILSARHWSVLHWVVDVRRLRVFVNGVLLVNTDTGVDAPPVPVSPVLLNNGAGPTLAASGGALRFAWTAGATVDLAEIAWYGAPWGAPEVAQDYARIYAAYTWIQPDILPPVDATATPSGAPTSVPSAPPTLIAATRTPTSAPSSAPSAAPTTAAPTTLQPSAAPTTAAPTTIHPTGAPTTREPTWDPIQRTVFVRTDAPVPMRIEANAETGTTGVTLSVLAVNVTDTVALVAYPIDVNTLRDPVTDVPVPLPDGYVSPPVAAFELRVDTSRGGAALLDTGALGISATSDLPYTRPGRALYVFIANVWVPAAAPCLSADQADLAAQLTALGLETVCHTTPYAILDLVGSPGVCAPNRWGCDCTATNGAWHDESAYTAPQITATLLLGASLGAVARVAHHDFVLARPVENRPSGAAALMVLLASVVSMVMLALSEYARPSTQGGAFDHDRVGGSDDAAHAAAVWVPASVGALLAVVYALVGTSIRPHIFDRPNCCPWDLYARRWGALFLCGSAASFVVAFSTALWPFNAAIVASLQLFISAALLVWIPSGRGRIGCGKCAISVAPYSRWWALVVAFLLTLGAGALAWLGELLLRRPCGTTYSVVA